MAAIKRFMNSFKKANRKGLRYEATTIERVWDSTSIVASFKTPIL